MAEDAGFLRAIRERPDDGAARLVYADWLEERGDPRGEYLRLEQQLAQLLPRLAQLQSQIDPTWLAAVRRRTEAEERRTWHDLRRVLAELPELEMALLEGMTWDAGSALRLGIWARNGRGSRIDPRFNGPTEIRCQRVTDWALRPVSPGWLLGGPRIALYEEVDARVLSELGVADINTEAIPHADEAFDPPLALQMLVLERGFVVAEQFEIAQVNLAGPVEAATQPLGS